MSPNRHFQRSLIIVTLLLAGTGVYAAARHDATGSRAIDAQDQSVQKLLERGALDAAVERAEAERDNVESTYLAAQALLKMDDVGRASETYALLQDAGDESWRAIGESGVALFAGNRAGAMDAAERAIAASPDNPYAHYQVGIVASRQNNFARAADAFGRTVELKPDFAYAHYYAGLANQRLKRMAKTSEHLETFMRLAPEAPERSAVAAILRTLRG
jgi:tetratricopeptide (TPR) repeat protein